MADVRIPYNPPTMADYRAAVARRLRYLEDKNKDPAFRAITDAARAEAAAAARVLKEEFAATRVRLFGSLARGDADDGFDIDLAVEGVEPKRFFSAWAAAGLKLTRRFDLIDLADAPPLLRQRVEEDGVDLP